jgi:gentisate 1,2-dioxygenase
VLEGQGKTTVGDVCHESRARDIFTLPEWQAVQHTASSARARMVIVSDEVLWRRLGLYREERVDDASQS